MDFDPKKLRARFRDLTEKHDAIRAKADPLRAERDNLVQAARADEDTLNAAIAKAEKGLYDIEQERAAIARALAGNTGEPK